MDKQVTMEHETEQKGLNSIKYGNPGIRTDVWRKMLGLYGEAIGTLIGLNMDIAVQMLNQNVITPVQKFQKSINHQENYDKQKSMDINKIKGTTCSGFKRVKVE